MPSKISHDQQEQAPGPGERYLPDGVVRPVKILIVGSFGVGKTTLIGAVSEIEPLRTEEKMSAASVGVDHLDEASGKNTTTVAMDFGRRTLTETTVLYLFGMPGQQRFWNVWEGLADGAIGALVLVDTRRLEASFAVLDQLEEQDAGMPYAVAVNVFPDSPGYDLEEIGLALDLPAGTPVFTCDARDPGSSLRVLADLTRHAIAVETGYTLAKGSV
jgi:signal recognition particle receptor subunit beta